MREAVTDDRPEGVSREVDDGFRHLDADLRALRTETKAEFRSLRNEMGERFDRAGNDSDRLAGRFGAVQRTLVFVNGAVAAALIALVVTRL